MITKQPFGKTPQGDVISLYTLTNVHGLEMKVINYGCIVTSIRIPDRNGLLEEVTLGYETLDQYIKDDLFFGAVIGRHSNRVANGKFSLDGTPYQLSVNNGNNHLHGGVKSFNKTVWQAEEHASNEGPSLKFTYTSPDGEEGYPGTLKVTVYYTLTNNNEFTIRYEATTDKKTIVNLTQHSYFNFSGNCRRDILDHEVWINADRYLPVNSNAIPTGDLQDVTGTPFDFRKPTSIGARIHENNDQLIKGQGYDHTWAFNNEVTKGNVAGASLYDKVTGRFLEVFTTQPGAQLYSGNFLHGTTGLNNAVYHRRYGLCMETQHFPDSPNKPQFPSVELSPGEVFQSQTTYRFSVKNN